VYARATRALPRSINPTGQLGERSPYSGASVVYSVSQHKQNRRPRSLRLRRSATRPASVAVLVLLDNQRKRNPLAERASDRAPNPKCAPKLRIHKSKKRSKLPRGSGQRAKVRSSGRIGASDSSRQPNYHRALIVSPRHNQRGRAFSSPRSRVIPWPPPVAPPAPLLCPPPPSPPPAPRASRRCRSCSRAARVFAQYWAMHSARRFSRAVSQVDARGMQSKTADMYRGRPKWASSVALAAATVILGFDVPAAAQCGSVHARFCTNDSAGPAHEEYDLDPTARRCIAPSDADAGDKKCPSAPSLRASLGL